MSVSCSTEGGNTRLVKLLKVLANAQGEAGTFKAVRMRPWALKILPLKPGKPKDR